MQRPNALAYFDKSIMKEKKSFINWHQVLVL
jgi:hypothetical protein